MRKLKRSKCAVLSLVLKGEWYDMIERGEKKEEYRDSTAYWAVRLSNWDDDGRACVVEFRRGYGHDAPRMAFTSLLYLHFCTSRNPEWGEPDGPHYAIFLDKRVELVDDRNQQRDRRKCVYYDGHGRCRVIPGEPPFTPPCRGWRRCKVYQERKGSPAVAADGTAAGKTRREGSGVKG